MIAQYDCDNPGQRALLLSKVPEPQTLPRRTVYGAAPGLIPVGDFADKLVDPKDYKEVIAHCHAQKIFPVSHQRASWAPPGVVWDQNGLNFCWAWGGTAAFMDLLSREGKPVPLLSPVSMGWLVNWRNAGNYLESMIGGLKERGVCEASFTPDMHAIRPSIFKPGWEDNAMTHRLGEVFDTDSNRMIQHAITLLSLGLSGYNAFNWWGHSTETVGVNWDESQVNNLVWDVRNSHKENDIIKMTGNKAVPDEFYGFSASKI